MRAFQLSLGADVRGVTFAAGLDFAHFHATLGLHALEDQLGDAFWQAKLLDAQKLYVDSVIVPARLGLYALENFLFDLDELELLLVGGDEMRKRMPAHDATERIA